MLHVQQQNVRFSVVRMNSRQMVLGEYWRGPDRRPRHRPVTTTGATRLPEGNAEASTTVRRADPDLPRISSYIRVRYLTVSEWWPR